MGTMRNADIPLSWRCPVVGLPLLSVSWSFMEATYALTKGGAAHATSAPQQRRYFSKPHLNLILQHPQCTGYQLLNRGRRDFSLQPQTSAQRPFWLPSLRDPIPLF